MADLTMNPAGWGFLISAENHRSFDEVSVDNTGGAAPLPAGTVLQGDGPYVVYASGPATGVLLHEVAAGVTAQATIVAREAEVVEANLASVAGSALAELKTLGVVAR